MPNLNASPDRAIISIQQANALLAFNQSFNHIFAQNYTAAFQDIIILCIGCDRSTGDALGPLVGSKLSHLNGHGLQLLGTLQQPVHAKNLPEAAAQIATHDRPFVIAVDAGLGNLPDVGSIIIKSGGLKPGSGVGKNLDTIGHLSIMGIVNVSGFMENALLQCTSLRLVLQMADLISHGLHYRFYIQSPQASRQKITSSAHK